MYFDNLFLHPKTNPFIMAVIKPNPAGRTSGKEKESKLKVKNVKGEKKKPSAKTVALKKKGKITVKAEFQVVLFLLTTTKKMALTRKFSKKHKGHIVTPPIYKHNMALNGHLKKDELFLVAAKTCFGTFITMQEMTQFQIGNIIFYVYHADAKALGNNLLAANVFYRPIQELRNKKKLSVDGKLHTIPKSCKTVLGQFGKQLLKESA